MIIFDSFLKSISLIIVAICWNIIYIFIDLHYIALNFGRHIGNENIPQWCLQSRINEILLYLIQNSHCSKVVFSIGLRIDG